MSYILWGDKMLSVFITSKDDKITKIEIQGHANYNIYGYDIVCAAASTLAIYTINLINELDSNTIDYEDVESGMTIIIKENNDIIDTILKVMIEHFQELEKDYPKNIVLKNFITN